MDALKVKFIDKQPAVKLDTPVVTELGDLPMWPYQQITKETGRGVVDVVHEWNGSVDAAAQAVIKELAKSCGKEDWCGTWDGEYKDNDVVKGLIADTMVKGRYDSLPNPFKPKQPVDVPYTMQLAVAPLSSGKWHIVKHFMFEERI